MNPMSRLAPFALAATLVFSGCATLGEIANLRQVDFSLNGVSSVRLAGVDLAGIRGVDDLTTVDMGRIALAVVREEVPLDLLLDVRAVNPEANGTNARLTRMDWTLFLDGRQTVSGIVDQEVLLEPGITRNVPIRVSLDLLEFFDGGAADLADVVLSLLDQGGSPSDLLIEATPTIETPLGPIRYPRPITIVNEPIGELARPGTLPR